MKYLSFVFAFLLTNSLFCQTKLDTLIPIRGFCIAAPKTNQVDKFVRFIEEELASRKVNTLILRVDFNYQFKKYPNLRDSSALSDAEVKKLVDVCRKHKINLIPQINLLGHQSWATKTYNLLVQYPHFDETPHVKMPEKYVWPNPDGLYCKSYCPLHPDVHGIVFSLVDEICNAFEAKDFHAGMDEVFYIGDDKCPRCQGRDKAELFAGEVNKIRNHLALSNRKLWIWGDRLIDGKTTGIGEWEGSYNQTFRAIDLMYKDIVICDWHYERPDPTAVYFAMKGFNVLTCPWRTPTVAISQFHDFLKYREDATPVMRDRYRGMIQTVWTNFESFQKEIETFKNSPSSNNSSKVRSSAECFISLFNEIETKAN